MNVAVVGGHNCSPKTYEIARELGGLIAKERWVLVCGGGPGVMEAVCRGAKEKDGLTVGILPSYDGKEANGYLDVKLTTGIGYARNTLVVRAADVVIALEGNHGTLSEIAFALCEDKIIYSLGSWDLKGTVKVKSPKEAIEKIKKQIEIKKHA